METRTKIKLPLTHRPITPAGVRFMKSSTCIIAIVVAASAIQSRAEITVPPGFQERLLGGPVLHSNELRIEGIRIPSYGNGAMSAHNDNGQLTLLRYDENGVQDFGTLTGYVDQDFVMDIKFDEFDVVGNLLWGSFRVQGVDADPGANDLIKIASNGDAAVSESIPGFVGSRMAISPGLNGYTPGAYLYDGDLTGGTHFYHFDGDVTLLHNDLVPPGRTDLDPQGMEFDPNGGFGDLLVIVDSDDHDQVSAIYGLKSNLNWVTFVNPVALNLRNYRGMAFSKGGDFPPRLFVTERVGNSVYAVAGNGTHTLFASGFTQIGDIAITPDGNQMYVVDTAGVHLIDRAPPSGTLAECVSVASGVGTAASPNALVSVGQPVIGASIAGGMTARFGFAFCLTPAGPVPMIPGDCDQDGDVDLADYACFSNCVSGPGGPVGVDCNTFDLDSDADIDLLDWQRFQSIFTGQL